MDVSSLIKMVHEREPLWNRKHAQYKDRETANMLWGQVAQYLNVDVETARYKWRGLRDTFRVQLRKLKHPATDSNVQNHLISKWEYFNDMLFVKDHIYLDVNSKNSKLFKLKESTEFDSFDRDNSFEDGSGEEEYRNLSDLCETEITEGNESIEEKFQITIEPGTTASEDSSQNVAITTNSNDSLPKDTLTNGRQTQLPNAMSILEDDNFCFLISLLPQMKCLPSKRNLYVRLKMQELLLNEVVNLYRET